MSAPTYGPCRAECNGCPECDPGLRPDAEKDVPLGGWFRRTPESLRMLDEETESLRVAEKDAPRNSWFRKEYERAKARNALIPPHARMVVTNPILSAHTRKNAPTRVTSPGSGRA